MAESLTSLSHCRHLYTLGQIIVASVGNGSRSSCSQGHSVFTLGLFAVLFPPCHRIKGILASGDTLRQTHLGLKWGGGKSPLPELASK